MRVIVKNCQLFHSPPLPPVRADLIVEDDHILGIEKPVRTKGDVTWNIPEGLVIPGLVDMHCHLREPGQEYKEDIKSGTLAAVSGGITTLAAMPNTIPVMDSVEKIVHLRNLISKKALCRVIPVAAMTKQQQGKILVDIEDLAELGVFLFSDDGYPIPPDILEEALNRTYSAGAYIIQHPENPEKVGQGVVVQGRWSKYFKVEGVDPDSEAEGVKQNLDIIERQPGNFHFTHISSLKAVNLIKRAKQKGVNISADTTPHHLSLTADQLKLAGSNAIMNPPLRTERDRSSIEQALIKNIIDFIATDHAPHSQAEKNAELDKVPKGVIGFQTMLGVCMKILEKHIGFSPALSLMTSKPADRFKLNAGRIIPGGNADFAVVVKQDWKVSSCRILGKSLNTPFEGMILPYKVLLTLVGGKVVYKSEDFEQYIECGKDVMRETMSPNKSIN